MSKVKKIVFWKFSYGDSIKNTLKTRQDWRQRKNKVIIKNH